MNPADNPVNEADMDDLYEETGDTQKDQYLMFRVNNENYGFAICQITEIIGVQKITELPDMPGYVKGMINLRGMVIPVIDVRLLFRMPERAYDDRTCIVVVDVNGTIVGLLVDTVNEVLDIPESQIARPPRITQGDQHQYIKGFGKVDGIVNILLDAEKLLQGDVMDGFETGTPPAGNAAA